MANAALQAFDLRVEFDPLVGPRAGSPSWRDITSDVLSADGLTLTRGRRGGIGRATPGTADLVLVNGTVDTADRAAVRGRYTPGYAGGPYDPLKIRRPVRVRVRPKTTAGVQVPGNMLTAEDASFEGGTTGTWNPAPFGYIGASCGSSSTRAHNGTLSMIVNWPTALSGASAVQHVATGLAIGRRYTLSMWVYVPSGGSPAVLLDDLFGSSANRVPPTGYPSTSSTTNAWQQLALSFTATASVHYLGVKTAGASSAGHNVWVDEVMIDEGATVQTFTTTAPAIFDVFTGHITDWAPRWQSGLARCGVSISDILANIGDSPLRGAIQAEVLYDAPSYYAPLNDPTGSVTAGNQNGMSLPPLASLQAGAGGAVDFGGGLAPGPDGGTVAVFTRVNSTNGRYLEATGLTIGNGISGSTIGAFVRPSNTTNYMTAARMSWTPDSGTSAAIGVNNTGKARAYIYGENGIYASLPLVGTTTLSTTVFTHLALTQSWSAGTITCTLYVNGVAEATNFYTRPFAYNYYQVDVGSNYPQPIPTELWDGQVCHVYTTDSPLSAARILEHSNARLGWTGELTSARFNRICRLVGLASTLYATSTGASTMASQPLAGRDLRSVLAEVEDAEAGVVAVDAAGRVHFYPRSARYAQPVALTLDARTEVKVDTDGFVVNDANLLNDYTVTRPSGAISRSIDSQSITDYGTASDSVTAYLDTDVQAQALAEYMAHVRSQPSPSAPRLRVSMAVLAAAGKASTLLGLDIGSRIQVTNLQAEAPTSTLDLFFEGVEHSIGDNEWTATIDTSAVGQSGSVMVLDDTTFGRLDTGGSLAF